MSPTTHDDLEGRVRELFDRQAHAMPVNTRAWDDPPIATVNAPLQPRTARSAWAAVLATAAAVALVVGMVAVAPSRGVHVAGQPGTAAAVHFATPQVRFDADALLIDANGQHFTSAGSTVDVHSDPGTRNQYTTLELSWNERGIEMRLYMYFASDGHDWWATELRTYNGKSPGDWIYYSAASYFRSPLGHAFTGNVDLAPTDGTGHLNISNLRLQVFPPPAACEHPTAKYALDVRYERVDMPKGSGGFGLGTTTLLDTASCTAVDPRAFSFDWTIANPAIAKVETSAAEPLRTDVLGADPTQSMNLAPAHPGATTLHVVARRRTNGQIVATADIPVTVG